MVVLKMGNADGDDWLEVRLLSSARITISLPQKMLQEVDGMAQRDHSSRSEVINQAVKMYIQERKKRLVHEMMRGYMEMARINLNLSAEAFAAEEEADRLIG